MLWNDVRYAFRLMRRSPGFTAVAVLSLALGIGANTAIYSLLYTIMLRQLPVADPGRLVEVTRRSPGEARNDGYWGWEKYEYFRDHNQVFSAIAGVGFDNIAPVHTEGSETEPLIAEQVTGNYFEMLGLKASMGRLSGPADVTPDADPNVAVVSWFFWNTRMHRDPAAIGKRIWVHDHPVTVVGVAPQLYVGPRVGSRTDLWLPYAKIDVSMLALLKPDVTAPRAEADLNVIYRSWLAQNAARTNNPKIPEVKVEVLPAGTGMTRVRDQYGKPLTLLIAVVGLLLLLACINMASMLLARSAGRQKELAVRVGLGAGRGRLVRQMLTESVLLSGAGTLVGVVVAYFGTSVLVRIMASGLVWNHIDIEVHPDFHLILFTAATALLTGLLFGLAPAWYAFRATPANSLRQTGRGGDTWFWRLFGKGLVTSQVALSILLVTGAAVFLGHVTRLRNFDLGFRSDHVLQVTLDLSRSGYKPAQLAAPYQELLARFERIPGVRSTSASGCTPLQGCGSGARFLFADGLVEPPEHRLRTVIVFVGPRYFETLGIPMMAGRDFTAHDAIGPRVAVVNESMARHFFPGVNPVGKHVRVDRDPKTGGWFGDDQPYEIIGVIADAKSIELREPPRATIYFDMFQENRLQHQFELRTSGNPTSLAGTVRATVGQVLKNVPIQSVTTLADQVDANIVPERLIAVLSEFFGGLGAVLAGIGLYGLLAYAVARRTNEIGVRMALGATAADVGRLVLRDALGMVGAGLLAGVAMVLWSKPVALSMIHDLQLETAAPLVLAGGAIFAIAVLAAFVPARRACRVDPMVALRQE